MFGNGKMKSSLSGYVTAAGRAAGNLKPKTGYIMPPKNSGNREGRGTVKKTAPVTKVTKKKLPASLPNQDKRSFGRLGSGV